MRKFQTRPGHFFVAIAILMLFTFNLNAQNKVDDISTYSLIEMAKKNTSNELCYLLSQNEVNNYYAVNTSTIDSRYVKIRILEQSYESDFLVNIGISSNELEDMIFIVKKSSNKNSDNVKSTINDFIDKANKELSTMNPERLRLWYMQHDKYQK